MGKESLWKRLCLLFVFTVCALAAGCSQKDPVPEPQEPEVEISTPADPAPTDPAEDETPREDVQYIQSNKSLKGKEMLLSENALIFKDTETGDVMYVCSIPGCTHSDWQTCTALRCCGECPVLYNDRIYVFLQNDEGNASLFSLNIDGTDIREECSFGEYSQESAFYCLGSVRVGDKLYFAVNYLKQSVDQNSQYVKQEFESLSLFEYDFTAGTSRELYKGEKGYAVSYGVQLRYSAGKLLLSYDLQKKSPEDVGYTMEEYMSLLMSGTSEELLELYEQMDYTNYNYEIDIESGERREYSGEGRVIGYQKGRLLLTNENQNPVWYDMETEKTTVISEEICRKFFQLDGVIIIGTGEVHTEETYWLLFEDKDEPVQWTRTKENLDFQVECAGDESLYIAWLPAWKDSFGEEWIYEFVNREDFLR
ncbi:MAG: hypothetical protein Q4C48_09605 [Lachnospiraceae bacterium]|nr:hypothetical protein [Lachnospiraceae bacterium]